MGKQFGMKKQKGPQNEIEQDKDIIIRAYKNAGKTEKEIKILAEVYTVSPKVIAQYLYDWNHKEDVILVILGIK